MANAKQRASMREGPLAALFRRTEEEGSETSSDATGPARPDASAASPAGDAESHPEASGLPATGTIGAADGVAASAAGAAATGSSAPAALGATAPSGGPGSSSAAGEAPSEAGSRVPRAQGEPVTGRLGGAPPALGPDPQAGPRPSAPHPSLQRAPQPPPRASEAEPHESSHPRSPKERLLDAFSSEIPANMMDTSRGRREPAPLSRAPAPEQLIAGGTAGHPVIRVIGVGGAGTNAVNRMVEAEVEGVEFVAVNTDLQSLQQSSADVAVHIGVELTRGLGSGSDANVGRQAAIDDYDHVKSLLKGSDMIFIAAGAGGGTGTGAAPVIARIAREVGALTVAIVTRPFGFEGSKRAEQAARGIELLAEEVDTLIVVPNNRLLAILDKQTSMVEAFKVADDVLRQGVQGISDLVTLPGLINLDFADVRTIMSDAGNALLGIGMGIGESRAVDAAMQAVASPLLETSMDGARSILLSITGGRDLSLWEVNEAAKAVSEAAHSDANIIFGAMVDEKLDDQVWVTVVATGYGDRLRSGERPAGGRLKEPEGEPRVRRTQVPLAAHASPGNGRGRRRELSVDEYDIPEFIPRR